MSKLSFRARPQRLIVPTVSGHGLVRDVLMRLRGATLKLILRPKASRVRIWARAKGGITVSGGGGPAPGPGPDPGRLPGAVSQAPALAAYAALNIPGRAAGTTYNDPTTNVKIWKVTSSSVPAANTGASHDYGEGGNQVSRGWGPTGDSHTILIRGDGMGFYLADFTRGAGLTNYRLLTVQPRRDLCCSFSSVQGFERILYIHTGTQLIRYNTQTMATANTGNFPLVNTIYAWLHQDLNDGWFVGLLDDNQTVWAWNSQTNQYLTHNETFTNEPRLERNGRYVVLTSGGNPTTVMAWDLSNNTFGPQQVTNYFSHLASLRGRWIAVDNAASTPPPLDRYQIVNGSVTRTQAVFNNIGGFETNNSGNWLQTPADDTQWAYISGVDAPINENLLALRQAVGLVRADGSEARLLLHHYTLNPNYYDNAWGHPSPDGRVALFNSNMRASGRYDLFVAEVPLSTAPPPPPPPSTGFFVSATAGATGSGTLANPWSLSTALAGAGGRINPGDTIWLRGGTYTNPNNCSLNGAPGQLITFRGMTGEIAILKQQFETTGNYLQYRDLVFEGPIGSNVQVYMHDCDHVTFTHNEVRNGSYNAGLNLSHVHDITVTYNYIHDNGTDTNNHHGIYFSGTSGPGTVIVNNLLTNNAARGLSMHSNGGAGVYDVLVAHNTIVGNGGTGILATDGDRRIIVNNVCAYNSRTTGSQQQIYAYVRTGAPGHGTGIPPVADKVWNNLTWDTVASRAGITNDAGAGFELVGNVIGDPRFVAAATNWHLLAGSPAIGLGRVGYATDDYDGKLRGAVVDSGAYEFV